MEAAALSWGAPTPAARADPWGSVATIRVERRAGNERRATLGGKDHPTPDTKGVALSVYGLGSWGRPVGAFGSI